MQLMAAEAECSATTALVEPDASEKPSKTESDKAPGGGSGGNGASQAAAPPVKAVLPRKKKRATKLQRAQAEAADGNTKAQPVPKLQQQVGLWRYAGQAPQSKVLVVPCLAACCPG